MSASARRGGFTLIEVLVALAIMAVGTTAAIGLFTAAVAMHKRAVDETTSAMVAANVIAELRGSLTLGFSTKDLPRANAATGGPAASPSTGGGYGMTPGSPSTPGTGPGGAAGSPPGGSATLVWRRKAVDPAFPGYTYDVLLTPMDADDPEEADTFRADVRVRWKSAAQGRETLVQTVVGRRAALRDFP